MARNTSVTLGDHFDKFVDEQIAQGRYQSVSEVVRAGLRKLEEHEARLKALRVKLHAGEDSPITEDFEPMQFIATLHKIHSKVI